MNPGAVEEVGSTARTFMDVMRTQPLALALAIMNVALLGLFYYITSAIGERRGHEFDVMMAHQKEVNQLLSQCIVPEKRP